MKTTLLCTTALLVLASAQLVSAQDNTGGQVLYDGFNPQYGALVGPHGYQLRDHIRPRGYWPQYSAAPWHGQYNYSQWGRPVALVVPPTAGRQSSWSWGVGNTTSTPIYHQYGRQYPGAAGTLPGGGGFQRTPQWPSHTDQFGVYYARSPW